MLDRYHNDPRQFTDEQKEKLARLAYMEGLDFDVKSKAVSKGLFDLVDTGLFGLVPNAWRPRSIGQEYHGESEADKWAGRLGTAAGIVPGILTGGTLLKGGLGLAGKGIEYGGKGAKAFKAMRQGRYTGMGEEGVSTVGKAVGAMKETLARTRAEAIKRWKQGYDSVPMGPRNPDQLNLF